MPLPAPQLLTVSGGKEEQEQELPKGLEYHLDAESCGLPHGARGWRRETPERAVAGTVSPSAIQFLLLPRCQQGNGGGPQGPEHSNR